jgi:hypothetical protein
LEKSGVSLLGRILEHDPEKGGTGFSGKYALGRDPVSCLNRQMTSCFDVMNRNRVETMVREAIEWPFS